jgi:hypothetical protein
MLPLNKTLVELVLVVVVLVEPDQMWERTPQLVEPVVRD